MAEGARVVYRLSESLRDIVRTFFHFWSLTAVMIIAAVLAFAGPSDDNRLVEVAMSIFQVSGTMVALVLPASELANTFITKFSDELLVKIYAEDVPDEKKLDTINNLSDQLRDNLVPAWRASVYALSSFLVSCVVMFMSRMDLTVRGVSFSRGYFLLGLSLGFVAVGAFWFFPTARYIFKLELLNDVKRFGEELTGSKKK